MRNFIVFLSVCLVAFYSCNNNPKTNTGDTGTQSPAAQKKVSSNLNDTGTQKLIAVITNYYGLKNALVATNEANTAAESDHLAAAAKVLQTYLLGKDGAPGPLKPYLDTIIIETRNIAAIKDGSCEKQRLSFSYISSSIYGLIKNAGLQNMNVYHQFCPMAFNEKGATWLSDESEIKNPYFGDKMLECGEVTDSLK